MQRVQGVNAESAESGSWYNQILDTSSDGIVTLLSVRSAAGDIVNFRIVQCNKAGYRMSGLPQNALGQHLLDVLPHLSKSAYFDHLKRVVETGVPYTGELFFHPTHIPGNNYVATFNRLGDGLVANFIDISQFRLLTKRVEDHSVLLDAIIENIPGGILLYEAIRNEKGTITDFRLKLLNRNAIEFTGVPKEEFYSHSYNELVASRGTESFFDECVQIVSENGQPYSFEYLMRTVNKWMLVTFVKLGDGVLMKMNDITERKLHELQLAEKNRLLDSVFNSSLIGISIMHIVRNEKGEPFDLTYKTVNNKVSRDIKIREQLYNQTYLSLYPEAKETGVWDKILYVINTGMPLHYEHYYKGSGIDGWFEVSMSRLDQDHLIVHSNEITEAVLSKLKLEEMVEELKRSNKNLQEFAMVASHDLQEPLRKVQYFMNYLQERRSSALSPEDMSIIDRAAKAALRMRDLINDLLTYSRVGNDQENFTKVSLTGIINTIISDLESKIHDKGGIVHVTDLPQVTGDEQQLLQLFQNLLSNAVKFAHPDRPLKIDIASSIIKGDRSPIPLPREQRAKKFCFISVSDNGIGFSQEYAGRIFNMFQRLHGNTEYEGTGIGLAIVKKVIDNHKAYIDAIGEPDQGATFRILFPQP